MNTHTQPRCPPRSKTPCTHIKQVGAAIPAARIQALTRPPDCPAVVHLHPRTENATVKHPKPDSC